MMKEFISKYVPYVLAAVALLVAIGWAGAILLGSGASAVESNNDEVVAQSYRTVSTGALSADDVQIELTPRGIVDGELVVDFRANTHGISLSEYDLAELSTLIHDGESVRASTATSMGGHHNSGTIAFPLDEMPGNFEIVIRSLPAQDERRYSWEALP